MKRSRGQMTEELRSYSQIETPYGLLIQKLDLPLIDGKVYHWYMANPFALLWWLVQHLVYFRIFFAQKSGVRLGRLYSMKTRRHRGTNCIGTTQEKCCAGIGHWPNFQPGTGPESMDGLC